MMRLVGLPRSSYELRDALALTAGLLRSLRRSTTFAVADDPLRLDLPPLLDGTTRPSPATLRLTGALYLQSELEQTGLVIATELLVRARDTLAVHDVLARKLEDYASAMRGAAGSEFLDVDRRAQLFARLFGVGLAAAQNAASVNRAFEQQLASLCFALLRVEAGYRFSTVPDARLDAVVRFAASALLLNIGARQYGVSSLIVSRLDQQMRRSIGILSDDELASMVGARGVWAVTRALLGENAPDSGRYAARGAAGQLILHWLADTLPLLENDRNPTTLAAPGNPVFTAAARWVVASGLAVPQAGLVQ